MSEDLLEYEDGWYEYGYCKLSRGKKKHVLLYYLGVKITDPAQIADLEEQIRKAPVS